MEGANGGAIEDVHKWKCGVGYYTDTQESVWLPLPGFKQSVYRSEFLRWSATVRGGLKRSRLSKPDGDTRRDETETLINELWWPSSLDRESGG
eukprot:5706522-Amphidinium_carterae.1